MLNSKHDILLDNMEALERSHKCAYFACLDALNDPEGRKHNKIAADDFRDALERMAAELDVKASDYVTEWRAQDTNNRLAEVPSFDV